MGALAKVEESAKTLQAVLTPRLAKNMLFSLLGLPGDLGELGEENPNPAKTPQ